MGDDRDGGSERRPGSKEGWQCLVSHKHGSCQPPVQVISAGCVLGVCVWGYLGSVLGEAGRGSRSCLGRL